MIHQKDLLRQIENEYPFMIVIVHERTTTMDGEYPSPYLAKTFEDAYNFAIGKLQTYWSDCKDFELDTIYTDSRDGKYQSSNPYYINSLDKCRETGTVWQTPDDSIYYYCGIFGSDDLEETMVEEYHNKLFDKNNLNMYYFNIIYVNDNIIEIGTTGRSHIGCKDSQWIDYGELYRKRKNCNSLDECITRFFERICICKPKDYPIFLFL